MSKNIEQPLQMKSPEDYFDKKELKNNKMMYFE